METDRGAVLTVRAAARGVVDFSRARTGDVNWWRRVNMLLRSMQADDDYKAAAALLAFQAGLLGNSSLTEDSFKTFQKAAMASVQDVLNLARPWAAKTSGQGDELESLMDTYRTTIGDPRDPEFMERLRADIARQQAELNKPEPETDDERVSRLLLERVLKK